MLAHSPLYTAFQLPEPALGVYSLPSTDYATAAQGTKADTAYGWGDHAAAGYTTAAAAESNALALAIALG